MREGERRKGRKKAGRKERKEGYFGIFTFIYTDEVDPVYTKIDTHVNLPIVTLVLQGEN